VVYASAPKCGRVSFDNTGCTGESPGVTVRYRSLIADNARWDGFELRPSDIVISTPPKCGTTWTQMLCALLIFDGPAFPAPLSEVSIWLDQTIRPIDEVRAIFAAQQHRRFIKTHTPLDGLPICDDVTYVVVGRDPRDVMISLEHHLENMDLERVVALRALAVGNDDLDTLPQRPAVSDDPTERFRTFVHTTEVTGVLNLTGMLHHLDTAWQRRHADNIVLCHYADFSRDLPGEIVRLGAALGYDIGTRRAEELAREASLDRMRSRAAEVMPNAGKIWNDDRAFFRAGSFGEWRSRVDDTVLAEYDHAVRRVASADLAAWAHNGRLATSVDPTITP
jgi:sulfotransferase family protein